MLLYARPLQLQYSRAADVQQVSGDELWATHSDIVV